jgi:hypothetical protein
VPEDFCIRSMAAAEGGPPEGEEGPCVVDAGFGEPGRPPSGYRVEAGRALAGSGRVSRRATRRSAEPRRDGDEESGSSTSIGSRRTSGAGSPSTRTVLTIRNTLSDRWGASCGSALRPSGSSRACRPTDRRRWTGTRMPDRVEGIGDRRSPCERLGTDRGPLDSASGSLVPNAVRMKGDHRCSSICT